jgi:putative transposase
MTNHTHLVAVPETSDSLWRTLHRSHGVYATRFNLKYGLSGHLWQARPFSCLLDGAHLWAAIRYVERNPVRARMVDCAENYPWSSAAAHCGRIEDALLDPEWVSLPDIPNWSQWLNTENDSDIDQRIRSQTFTGRPCGDDRFVRETERLLGRNLAPQRPGPKPRTSGVPKDSTLWTTDEIRF